MTDTSRTIAITGAGSGFGRALAQRYAAAGWKVAISDANAERAEETLQLIGGQEQGHLLQQLDVRETAQWQQWLNLIEQQWGGLDVLVNNAGVAAGGRLEETPLDDWQWIMDIDLMGVVKGCHTFIPLFRRQQRGHIVNIASFAGLAGAPQIAAYGTAKAGVVAMSELIRAELHDVQVGVSVVCPSFVKTNLLETFRSSNTKQQGLVERWMERSSVSADDIANDIYAAVENNTFLVLTHRETRWLWRLKRWLPGTYFKLMMRSTRGKR
ncbi:MAG: SDR family oxidoreductase [Wenzhouxiangellaceae bacterium]